MIVVTSCACNLEWLRLYLRQSSKYGEAVELTDSVVAFVFLEDDKRV